VAGLPAYFLGNQGSKDAMLLPLAAFIKMNTILIELSRITICLQQLEPLNFGTDFALCY